jgi:hypothetical protein
MNNEQQRLTLAGHVITGLLASQDNNDPWDAASLAVTALRTADAVLHFNAQEALPEPSRKVEEAAPEIIIQPKIITPRE